MTMSPAAVTPAVSPLSKEKGLYSPPNFTLSLGPGESLCGREQPILCGCLKKAAVSIMLWQHFMLQNDKWRGRGRAEVQLKHAHTHTHTHTHSRKQWHRRVWALHGYALYASLFQLMTLCCSHTHTHTHTLPLQVRLLELNHSQRLWERVESGRGGANRLTRPTSPSSDPGEWEVAVAVPPGPVAPLSSGQSSSFPPPT